MIHTSLSSSLLLVLQFLCLHLQAKQRLHVSAYGNPDAPAIIFLHGGPGYNSSGFEATTARPLAEMGFQVISYDRRGEGRSIDHEANYCFEEAIQDLLHLMKQRKISKASFIGHSFGGMVGTIFALQHPEKVRALYLVGAPIQLQESFRTILQSCENIYRMKGDSLNLGFIDQIRAMDTSSLQYGTLCFSHAMQNGFYSTKNRNPKALELLEKWKTDPELGKYASQMTTRPPQGFWKNDHYTTLDLRSAIQQMVGSGIPVKGLYGKEDGLYSAKQVSELQAFLGEGNLHYWNDCSHNVFIDQHDAFLQAIVSWEKALHKQG